MIDFILLLLAYILGCFSTAYYLVRWRTGEDVRRLGSGNAGATNAGRVLGKWGFIMAVIGDVGKAALAIWFVRWLGGGEWAMAWAIPAVVMGHIWPIQLGFRGGEGFASAFGAVLVYHPLLVGIVSGVALLFYLTTRKRSVAGAIALLITPPLAWFLGGSAAEISALIALVVLMLWAFRRHLHTIFQGRLIAGKSSHG
ncbi:MAG: glycerol-3-phosphate acyltransferase [Caldilineaceae bacterium]|nr:glycerol-3-phosphate acyltransferase [Caldilineaceae bacterium]